MSKIKVKSGAADPVAIVPISPLLDHQCVSLGTGVLAPTRPPGVVRGILVQAIDQNIRYTIGTYSSPTASCGFRLVASDPPTLIPLGPGLEPRFIRETAGAVLEYQWVE